MKISIAITSHNQTEQIAKTICALNEQTEKPYHIYLLMDGKKDLDIYKNVTVIDNKENSGRCNNRNSVIVPFLNTDSEALIFIDGDSWPSDNNFIKKYRKLFKKYDLIYGTRKHTPVDNIKMPASDLLTANMDELWQGKPLNYNDLRITSGAIKAWHSAESISEKIDLILTGMITWSCNFGIARNALAKHILFMEENYGIKNKLFDDTAFSKSWGYEDVAMGLDSIFAGLKIEITDDIEITHLAHERSDGLFDHIKGRHLIMERYRHLYDKYKQL